MNRDIFKKADIIIYAAILLLAAAAFLLYFHLHRDTGDTVVVSVNGEERYRFPLDSGRSISDANDQHTAAAGAEQADSSTGLKIEGYNGGYVVLVIRDGRAEVTEATCLDHICVKHPPISHTGESIVCLPNRVVVTIETAGTNAKNEADGIDAVSQ